jgi:hypothetical protein
VSLKRIDGFFCALGITLITPVSGIAGRRYREQGSLFHVAESLGVEDVTSSQKMNIFTGLAFTMWLIGFDQQVSIEYTQVLHGKANSYPFFKSIAEIVRG